MQPREWQVIVSDGQNTIKQLFLSKLVGYSLGVLVSTSLLSMGMMIYVISQQSNENEALQSKVQELNQRFHAQHEKIMQYEEEKYTIARQLVELRELEEQMNDLVADLNPGRIAAFSDGPQGGLEEGLVKSSEFSVNQDYSRIGEEVSQLVASYQTAVEDMSQVAKDLKRTPIDWPADTEVVSSAFGYRTDPFTNVSSFHGGIDLAGPLNTEIYATGHGVIEFAGWNGAYGQSVLINHGHGYKSRYSHLNDIIVEKGDQVKQGQLIGLMGSTGRSTGVHLHYEVLEGGERVDPYPFMTFIQNALNE